MQETEAKPETNLNYAAGGSMLGDAKALAPQQPTVGRTVHYRLSDLDATQINRRRVAKPHEAGWPAGAQAHIGNNASPGDIVPLVVVRVWSGDMINGQALLDGNDQLWVTSAHQGNEPGQWNWPPRV